MKNSNSTPEQIALGVKTINELLTALEGNLATLKETLKTFPQGENLQIVYLNEVWTVGLKPGTMELELVRINECRGYDSETARAIKKAFKGKDGNGREIQTSELEIKNGRNFIHKKMTELGEMMDKYKQALENVKNS